MKLDLGDMGKLSIFVRQKGQMKKVVILEEYAGGFI
jgi:hypothetical protein